LRSVRCKFICDSHIRKQLLFFVSGKLRRTNAASVLIPRVKSASYTGVHNFLQHHYPCKIKLLPTVRLGFCSRILSAKYLTINRSVSSVHVKLDKLSYSRTIIIYNRSQLYPIGTVQTCKSGGFLLSPPNSIMTRDSNHGRCLQSTTFRGCVACSGSTCNSSSVQFGMHSPPSVSAEGDRQCQRERATVGLRLSKSAITQLPKHGNCSL
jgi:hypothetical protein